MLFGKPVHGVTLWRFSCTRCMNCVRFLWTHKRIHPPPPFTLSVFPVYHLIKICFFRLTSWFTVFASLLELESRLDPQVLKFHMSKLNSTSLLSSLPSTPTLHAGVNVTTIYLFTTSPDTAPSSLPLPFVRIASLVCSPSETFLRAFSFLTCVGKLFP